MCIWIQSQLLLGQDSATLGQVHPYTDVGRGEGVCASSNQRLLGPVMLLAQFIAALNWCILAAVIPIGLCKGSGQLRERKDLARPFLTPPICLHLISDR